MEEFNTMLDALIAAHGHKGGTIHDFSRKYSVDMMKARPPFLVRKSRTYGTDIICTVNGSNVCVPVKPGKYAFGATRFEAMREHFNA